MRRYTALIRLLTVLILLLAQAIAVRPPLAIVQAQANSTNPPIPPATVAKVESALAQAKMYLLAARQAQVAAPSGMVYYVNRNAAAPIPDGLSWTTAFTEVQPALLAAVSGDEIWVAGGVYKPDFDPVTDAYTGSRDATFQLKNGIALFGGFAGHESLRQERDWTANLSVLSGDIDENDLTDPYGVVTDTLNITGDNAYHVVTGSATDASAVLDGFLVTAGKAHDAPTGKDGGGMYNNNGSPTIRNTTFRGNTAVWGGGIANYNYSSPILVHTNFQDNNAREFGGGMSNDQHSSPSLVSVIFSRNKVGLYPNYDYGWGGGGLSNYRYGNLVLVNVIFEGNAAPQGGGMLSEHADNLVLVNTAFIGNHATKYPSGQPDSGGGGLAVVGSHLTLYNAVFISNATRAAGGGLLDESLSATLVHVTFTANYSSGDVNRNGGAIYSYGLLLTLHNCIAWANLSYDGSQIDALQSNTTITYSDVQGGWPGTGNIDADPLFVDVDGIDNIPGTLDDNVQLRPNSPAIDAGDNNALPLDTLDLDGDGDTGETLPLDLAGKPRQVDAPAMPDTGSGDAPIVDMGAYEFNTTDLVLAKSHTGYFFQGQTDASYSLVVSNQGVISTTGAVTVTDSLPSGLTATALQGDGWNCSLETLSCTRDDPLEAGQSYPTITLTVNVAVDAPCRLTNQASVSGGGEVIFDNNSAADLTIIWQRYYFPMLFQSSQP